MSVISSLREQVIARIHERRAAVEEWLSGLEQGPLPLYSSVDIRDAGFKTAVVDTNIFPAGFNNLCEHGLAKAAEAMRQAIERIRPCCKNLLIIAEEHTRNTWYLENVRILQTIIAQAGYNSKIATFLTIQPAFCEGARSVEFETAKGHPVTIHCLQRLLTDFAQGKENFCLIILNNDLTSGVPDVLKNSKIPIYPSACAGWHARRKSEHFQFTNQLIGEFAQILGLDPWLFSCLDTVVENASINVEADRQRISTAARELYGRIQAKYTEHGIPDKPYLIIKADAGTYGMGVMAIENPEDIAQLNHRERYKMSKGKSAVEIHNFLIQEGVPTIHRIDELTGEVCLYQIENQLIGGFYRLHAQKGERDNLNSTGMEFRKLCPHAKEFPNCGVEHSAAALEIDRLLARIAGVAAQREIEHLEGQR